MVKFSPCCFLTPWSWTMHITFPTFNFVCCKMRLSCNIHLAELQWILNITIHVKDFYKAKSVNYCTIIIKYFQNLEESWKGGRWLEEKIRSLFYHTRLKSHEYIISVHFPLVGLKFKIELELVWGIMFSKNYQFLNWETKNKSISQKEKIFTGHVNKRHPSLLKQSKINQEFYR